MSWPTHSRDVVAVAVAAVVVVVGPRLCDEEPGRIHGRDDAEAARNYPS